MVDSFFDSFILILIMSFVQYLLYLNSKHLITSLSLEHIFDVVNNVRKSTVEVIHKEQRTNNLS